MYIPYTGLCRTQSIGRHVFEWHSYLRFRFYFMIYNRGGTTTVTRRFDVFYCSDLIQN